MEKTIEFLKKNWIWIVIAIVVIYLLTRKKKTESNYRIAPSGVKKIMPNLYNTGWYNFSGSVGIVKDEANVARYFSNGNCGERWSLNYSQCRYIISGPGKIEGYYFYGNQFRVKKIITNAGTFDFSGDTFLDTTNMSPTNTPQEAEQVKRQYPLVQLINGTITPIQTTQRVQ